MKSILGIDLGTSNSCICMLEGGSPRVVPNRQGEQLTPSVVQFLTADKVVVGSHAYRARLVDPVNTITGIKRLMGRRFNEVFDLVEYLPYKVVADEQGWACVEVFGRLFTPQEISALLLRSLKQDAEAYLGEPLEHVVLTVPAYFNPIQREATREAARLADLVPARILVEPTAAGLAYGLHNRRWENRDRIVAVFDLGGGTFDISLVEISDGVLQVLAIAGDGLLGGDDFTSVIVDWMLDDIQSQNIDIDRFESELNARVQEAAEEAKRKLSAQARVSIRIPYLKVNGGQPFHYESVLTQQHLEELSEELLERLRSPCLRALREGFLTPPQSVPVLLAGGATRMKCIDRMVREIFGTTPGRNVNLDECVAYGAAIQAAVLARTITDMVVFDATEEHLGIELNDGTSQVLLPRNTTIPARHQALFDVDPKQRSAEVRVFTGPHRAARNNLTLAILELQDVSGSVQVTFDVNASNALNVSVLDVGSGRTVTTTPVVDSPWGKGRSIRRVEVLQHAPSKT